MASLPWRWVAVTTVASVVGSEQTTTTAAPDIVDLIPSQIDLCSTSSDCCGDAQCLIPEGVSCVMSLLHCRLLPARQSVQRVHVHLTVWRHHGALCCHAALPLLLA